MNKSILKKCVRCHTYKPMSDFCKYSRMEDGLYYYCKICHRFFRKQHADKMRKDIREHEPWRLSAIYINQRCGYNKYYKQVENSLSDVNLKYLWFRDRAYLMKKPSIDRINPDGHYMLKNCRYIELSENRASSRTTKGKKLSEEHKRKIALSWKRGRRKLK